MSDEMLGALLSVGGIGLMTLLLLFGLAAGSTREWLFEKPPRKPEVDQADATGSSDGQVSDK